MQSSVSPALCEACFIPKERLQDGPKIIVLALDCHKNFLWYNIYIPILLRVPAPQGTGTPKRYTALGTQNEIGSSSKEDA